MGNIINKLLTMSNNGTLTLSDVLSNYLEVKPSDVLYTLTEEELDLTFVLADAMNISVNTLLDVIQDNLNTHCTFKIISEALKHNEKIYRVEFKDSVIGNTNLDLCFMAD